MYTRRFLRILFRSWKLDINNIIRLASNTCEKVPLPFASRSPMLPILLYSRVAVLRQHIQSMFLTRDMTELPNCFALKWNKQPLKQSYTAYTYIFVRSGKFIETKHCPRNDSATISWENERTCSARSNTLKLRNFWRHGGYWPISTKIILIWESPAKNKLRHRSGHATLLVLRDASPLYAKMSPHLLASVASCLLPFTTGKRIRFCEVLPQTHTIFWEPITNLSSTWYICLQARHVLSRNNTKLEL